MENQKVSSEERRLNIARPAPSKGLLWLARSFKGLAVGYLLVLIGMMALETRLVFPGADRSRGDWTFQNLELEKVTFESLDGTQVHGIYFKHLEAKRTILFCHGNGENIAMIAGEMNRLRNELQANVLAFDYRGFGDTKGSPSEGKILEDAEAALEWLSERSLQPIENVVIFGRSLGGGVAVHLATKFDSRVLILDRTFSSTVDVAASRFWWLPVRMIMRNQFWSNQKIRSFQGAILQMHGDADEVVPYWSGRKLFQAAKTEDKLFVDYPGLTHLQPWPETWLPKILEFLDQHE
jgi:uncharacterized protein